jgi:putative ABC transport system permease protein
MTARLRIAMAEIDRDLPLYRVMTMKQVIRDAEWNGRTSKQMLLTITLLTLAFSVVSLYAVTAHGVVQRTHEIGIRVALGAERQQVRRLIARRAFMQVALGLVAGIAATMAWDTIFFSGRVNLRFADPIVLIAIGTTLAIVSSAACVIPVRRAVRLDATQALRHE